ncbi:MAG: hypothetical protein ACW96X_08795, partial [Promethearchaeota archaeon]
DWGWDAQLFSCGVFDETTLTWDNKDNVPIYGLVSTQGGDENTISWDLGDLSAENQYFEIDPPDWGGYDFTDPIVKYSLAKKHQEGGLLYMQTNEVGGELLTLKSSIYNSNITVTPNDQIVVEYRGYTDNKVSLTLHSDGDIQQVYTLIPEGNTDYTTQFIILETDQLLQFDQLNFTGILDDTEYFSVNSITVMEGASLIDAKLWEYPFTIDDMKPNIDDGDGEGSNPINALAEDDLFYTIDSTEIQVDEKYRTSVEFEFVLTEAPLDDVDKLQIRLIGQSAGTLLEEADYSLLDIFGDYPEITPVEKEGALTFTILREDFETYLIEGDNEGENDNIVFKIEIEESSEFTISIDKLSIITFNEWSAEHDFYRAAFKFEKLGDSQFGNVTLALNNNVTLTINDTTQDSTLKSAGQENLVSFNYDFTTQKWSAYINDDFEDKLNLTDTNPTMNPRIETWYNIENQGIVVNSIESHYYKKVVDQADFEKYKSLILSYQDKLNHSATLQTDSEDLLLTPENTFAQLSADIDIIYSFNDEMTHDNIFSYNLQPTFTSSYSDNIDTYQYNESSFIIESVSSLVNSTVSSFSGDSGITSGTLSNLNDIYSNNVEFETEWITERYDGSPTTTVTGGYVEYENAPNGWDYRDDGTVRTLGIWDDSSSSTMTVKDTYSFTNLPSWVTTAADKEVEIQLSWDYDGEATSGSCELWAMNWNGVGDGDDFYENKGSLGSSGAFRTNTISLQTSNLEREHSSSTTYEARIQIKTQAQDPSSPYYIEIYVHIDYLYLDFKGTDASISAADFSFNGLLNGENDFVVYFRGKTDGFTSKLLINNVNEQSFSSTFTQYEDLLLDIDSIKAWIADDGEIFHPFYDSRTLILDNLEVQWLNQPIDYTLENSPISLNSSASRQQNSSSYLDSGMFDDPFFGKNSIQFTLKNTLYTPIFGRSNASAFVDLELSDLDLDFEVFPNSSASFVLEDPDIEGKNIGKYSPSALQNYTEYSSSRFRNSALDDIQIPLVTPISLDFDQLTMDELSQGNLEIALNLDIDLENRADDANWSTRFRLLYYNYTSQHWNDFNGILRASNDGETRYVWNPDTFSDNFAYYLQYVG